MARKFRKTLSRGESSTTRASPAEVVPNFRSDGRGRPSSGPDGQRAYGPHNGTSASVAFLRCGAMGCLLRAAPDRLEWGQALRKAPFGDQPSRRAYSTPTFVV